MHILMRLFRLEYWWGLLIGAAATVLLWYRPEKGPTFGVVLLTGLYLGLLYFSGFPANAMGDFELDSTYINFKQEIAQTVEDIGTKWLAVFMWSMVIIGLGFGVWLCWLIQSWIPIVMGIPGLVAGLGYSLEPLRWKVRGFMLHFLSISYAVFFLPMFIAVGVLTQKFTLLTGLIAVGFALAHYALEIGNQLKDYSADQSLGIFTLPSRSIRSSILFGAAMLGVGLLLEAASFTYYFSLSLIKIIIMVLIMGVSNSNAILVYARTIIMKGDLLEPFNRLNYSLWQSLGMVGYLGVAVLIRFFR